MERLIQRMREALNRWAPWGTRRRTFLLAPLRAVRLIRREGWRAFLVRLLRFWRWIPDLFRRAVPQPDRLSAEKRYGLWLGAVVLVPDALREARRAQRELPYRPLISLVMPTFNSKPGWLEAAVGSVMEQVYPEWELCIVDDGSTDPRTNETLRSLEARDPRIKVRSLGTNQGISAASNEALALATGEFVGFLDHDDELRPIALYEVVRLLNEQPDLDFIYSDEDKKEPDGRLTDVFFKPEWSPDLLLSVNYVTHFSVYRKEVVDQVGGFRRGYEGSQDYDLILRVSEHTDRIARIPLPLYTWRKVPGSAAAAVDAKSYAFDAGRRAIQDALDRRGIRATVEEGQAKARYRVRYEIEGSPTVQIIVPTRDRVDLLRRCIESVQRNTEYPNYEITIIDNQSEDPSTLEYLRAFRGRVIPYPHPFNYARMMNEAASHVGHRDLILFLNNDIEVIGGEWLQAMIEHAQRPEVAAVGARLFYPGDVPQHEGIIVGPGRGLAANINWGGYFHLGQMVRNYSAVTGACMMIRPEVFRELGGFDEKLTIAYNDVDLCLRATEKGYLIVYTPYATLYHLEGATRGRGTHPAGDNEVFRERWGSFKDPYWNPNQDFANPFAPRLQDLVSSVEDG